MRQNYLKILIGIICVLWIIYFIQNVTFYKNEGFIPMGASIYRQSIRNMNQVYEQFSNNYDSHIIMTKLKKYKIL
jgi:hypothetical protein